MKHKHLSCQKNGFSLVELLISLIIISCITAAFTPLITKKFSSGVFGSGGGSVSDITNECDKFSSNCTLCTNDFCIVCSGLSCGVDEYKDTKTCSCKKCVDKYGADCNKCNDNKCLTCPNGEYLDNSDESCKSCTNKFSNCTSCDENKCAACKDGYVLENPTSSNPCTNFECGGDDFIQIGSLCITKKNMGDGDKLTIPSGVNVVNAGTSCSPSASNLCCWKGTTASPCDNENGGGYSGCTRTVCEWYAADYICKNFKAGGYTWRLATTSEMSNWANNSKGKGVNGLQLCDDYSGYSSAQCHFTTSCPGSKGNWCSPHIVWSGTVFSSSYAYFYYLLNGGWNQNTNIRTSAVSVRCVSSMPQSCADRFGDGCLTCDGSTCLSCDSGYILKDGKCVVDCASKFGSSCSECNMAFCTKCADGYHMSSNSSGNPACESDFTCSGSDFMQIGSLCVTRRNMGDSTALAIPSGVNVVNVGSTCNASGSNKCCWKGTTARPCNNENGGGYSGCNRTVCNWSAADYICKNFSAGGYTWRLATTSEMSNWGTNSTGKGVNGLQLCHWSSQYLAAECGSLKSCRGSGNDYCRPDYAWSTPHSDFFCYLYNTDFKCSYSGVSSANSVRCVTEL